MIQRQLEQAIRERLLKKQKAVLLVGPRQTGKTTLIRTLMGATDFLFVDGDDPTVREQFQGINTEQMRRIVGQQRVIFVDEAQRIPNIGLTLKILTDQFPDVQLYVSGSSAFDLHNHLNEPLTGRKWEYHLFPLSWRELEAHFGYLKARQQLETRLVYGMYPEVVTSVGLEREVLRQLTTSYLYKDVLSLAGLRKPEVLEKLLKALAFQVGSEVSYNELGTLVGADKNTVSSYLDILEKTFVIFRLHSFSRNLRNEISTSRKIYFYDNGVRNALIGNYTDLSLRMDKGALWENFLISERLKQHQYKERDVTMYFWRTAQQQEIDLVEEQSGQLRAFEFKFTHGKKARMPLTFAKAYPDAQFQVVDAGNFVDFVG